MEDDQYESIEEVKAGEEEKGKKGKGQKKKTATSHRRVKRPVFRPSENRDVMRILEQAEDQAREMGLSEQQAAQIFESLTSKLVTPVADPRPKKPKKGRRNRYSSDED